MDETCQYQGCGKPAIPYLHDDEMRTRPQVGWYCAKCLRQWNVIQRKVGQPPLKPLTPSEARSVERLEVIWRKQCRLEARRREKKEIRRAAMRPVKKLRSAIDEMLLLGHSVDDVKTIVDERDVALVMGA